MSWQTPENLSADGIRAVVTGTAGTGKAITDDGASGLAWATVGGLGRALLVKTSDQGSLATSAVLVTWNTSYLSANFSISSNELTVTDAGDYRVYATIATSGTSAGAFCILLMEDWTSGARVEIQRSRDFATSSTNQYPKLIWSGPLAANTKLRFYTLQSTGTGTIDADGNVAGPTKGCFALIERIA